MRFSSLEEIKDHCDTLFPNNAIHQVDSQISSKTDGTDKTYTLRIHLNLREEAVLQKVFKELEGIANIGLSSGFSVSQPHHGPVSPSGYHFNITIK